MVTSEPRTDCFAIAKAELYQYLNQAQEVAPDTSFDIRIAELETQLLSSVPLEKNNDEKTTSIHFSTWGEVTTALRSDRSKLLNTVKNWSTEERQKLSKLLSEFLESEPEGLERAAWVL